MIGSVLSFARDEAKHEPRSLVDLSALVDGIRDDASDAGEPVTFSGPRGVTISCRPTLPRSSPVQPTRQSKWIAETKSAAPIRRVDMSRHALSIDERVAPAWRVLIRTSNRRQQHSIMQSPHGQSVSGAPHIVHTGGDSQDAPEVRGGRPKWRLPRPSAAD
jgi:hypothetical protein